MNRLPKLYSSLTRSCFICKIYQGCLNIYYVHVNYFSFMPFYIGWVKNFNKITLSCTVKEIEANLCFAILVKFENSKWPPFLGRGKYFENCQEYISQRPCGLKI